MDTDSRTSRTLKWLVTVVPALFGGAALYAFKQIWDDGFVKERQRSWPIQHIYSASEDPLVYYSALVLCLAWGVFCFGLAYRMFKGMRRSEPSRH